MLCREMIHGDRPMAGIPETVTVPPALLTPFKAFRKAFKQLLKDSRATTIEQMKKCFLKHKAALLKTNRSAILDYTLLDESAELMLTQKIHTEVLAVLPKKDAFPLPTMQAVAMKLSTMRNSAR